MDFWIVTFGGPLSRAFLGLTTFNATLTRDIPVALLPTSTTLGAGLTLFRHIALVLTGRLGTPEIVGTINLVRVIPCTTVVEMRARTAFTLTKSS